MIKNVTGALTDNVVIEYVWEPFNDINSAKYNLQASVAEGQGEFGSLPTTSRFTEGVFFSENTPNGTVYELTATPDAGYMLDYWEYTMTEDNWTDATKIENDTANSKAILTETIAEDRWYRAVFKPWEFILGNAAAITPILNDVQGDNYFTRAGNLYGYAFPSQSEQMKAGFRAAFYLQVGIPSAVLADTLGAARFNVYAGDVTSNTGPSEEPIASCGVDTYFIGEYDVPPFVRDYVLIIDALPNATGVTVEAKVGEKVTRKYYPLTITYDPLRDYRLEKAAALQPYYDTTFGKNPPDADTEAGVDALYNAAIAKLTAYTTLRDQILVGNGEYYKQLDGVVKVVFNMQRPVFAYVPALGVTNNSAFKGIRPEEARAYVVLEAGLEADYPGVWYVHGGGMDNMTVFITVISTSGDDGANIPGGPTMSGIVYVVDHVYATGGFAQYAVPDRGVMRIGSSGGKIFPPNGPNKDDLIWAIAALRERYPDSYLSTIQAYTSALGVLGGWATPEQTEIDALLAALQVEFPEDEAAMRHYDLPDEVLAVIRMIRGIGFVTPQSDGDIAAAEAAYEALSDENKALVKNYQDLLDARAALDALDDDVNNNAAGALTNVLDYIKTSVPSPAIGSTEGEWAVFAVARGSTVAADDAWARSYLTALSQAIAQAGGLDEIGENKYTEYARITLALTSLGQNAAAYAVEGVQRNIAGKLLEFDNVTTQGINGAIFALIALDSKPYFPAETAVRQRYVNYILDARHDDGGWSLEPEKEKPSDPDVTAMALQALANAMYKSQAAVQTAIAGGLAVLKDLQDPDYGGFYSFGEYNSESSAQVIVALTALGIDPEGADWIAEDETRNPLTALLQFLDSSNGFKHALNDTVNPMATEQAAYALAAYKRFKDSGATSLYDMTDVVFDTTPSVSVGAQSGTLTAGTAGSATFSVTAANIANGSYTATLTGAPEGVTAPGFVMISSGSGSLTLTTTAETHSGSYPVTLKLEGNGADVSAAFTLTVNAAPGVKSVIVGTQSGTLTAGAAGSASFSVTTGNIADGTYTAALIGAPTGVTASGVTVSNNTGTLTLTTTPATPAGSHPLTLTLGGATSAAFILTVSPAPGATKSVTVGAQSVTLTTGTAGSASFPITAANIANGTYTAVLAGAPAGVTGSVTVSNNTGILTLATTAATPAGGYSITLTLDGATSAAFILTVSAANANPDPDPNTDPTPIPIPNTDPDPDPTPNPNTDPTPDPNSDPEPDPNADPDPETEPEPDENPDDDVAQTPSAGGDARFVEVPFVPADGDVETPSGVRTFTVNDVAEIANLPGLAGLPPDVIGLLIPDVAVDGNGVLVAGAAAVINGLSAEDASEIDAAATIPLPIFHAEVNPGKAALVAIELNLDGFAGKRLGSVDVLKLKSDGTTARLDIANSPQGIAHAQYVWTDEAGGAVAPGTLIEAGKAYRFSLAIKDDSAYDWDPAPASVVDPLALAVKKTAAPVNDETDENGEGGGGGCDAGMGDIAVFILTLALIAKRRRKAA
jgi:hypothetical protein